MCICTYVHIMFLYADAIKSNIQENLRYQSRRLQKGVFVSVYSHNCMKKYQIHSTYVNSIFYTYVPSDHIHIHICIRTYHQIKIINKICSMYIFTNILFISSDHIWGA